MWALPFWRNLFLFLQGISVCSPETVVQIFQMTHCHNPEGYNMYLHCIENLISVNSNTYDEFFKELQPQFFVWVEI